MTIQNYSQDTPQFHTVIQTSHCHQILLQSQSLWACTGIYSTQTTGIYQRIFK